MSQAFKYNFGDVGNNKTDKNGEQLNTENARQKNYAQPGYNRNICFQWLDGRCVFLSYSYLISAELASDQTTISLDFTTHSVKLSGFYLQKLFEEIMEQTAMHIHCVDARYNTLNSSDVPIINSIDLQRTT